MAWTSSIAELIKESDQMIVRMIYSNGNGRSVTKEYRPNSSDAVDLKTTVSDQISRLNNADSLNALLSVGPFDPTVTTSPKTTPQANRDAYAANLALYRHWKSAIDVGVVTSLNSTYIALVSTLNSTFDPSYIDLF